MQKKKKKRSVSLSKFKKKKKKESINKTLSSVVFVFFIKPHNGVTQLEIQKEKIYLFC